MIQAQPPASDIVSAFATATTVGIVTIPGERWLTANVQLSAAVAALGASSNPFIAFQVTGGTTGAAPADGSVLARINVTATTLTTVAVANTTEIFVYGGDNGCTLDFTAGASGTSSVTINGFLI